MRCTISQIYLIKYSTYFGQVHCPPSGVSQHCIHAVGICHASSVGCRQRQFLTANSSSLGQDFFRNIELFLIRAQINSFLSVSIRTVLVLCSHLRLCLPSNLFLTAFLTKHFTQVCTPPPLVMFHFSQFYQTKIYEYLTLWYLRLQFLTLR